MSTIQIAPAELSRWFDTPLGQYLLAQERDYYDCVVADIFGYNALQSGLAEIDFLRASRIPSRWCIGSTGPIALKTDFRDLPIAANSIDLVVLPHVLEFSDDPHQILREVVRVLVPEGHVVISGFNPWSLLGLKRFVPRSRSEIPWNGRFINLPRLKDWLSLLSFDVVGGRMHGYAPPFSQEHWLRRFSFMDSAGDRWWPFAGGVYLMQAVKRVRGMRVITPSWRPAIATGGNVVALRRVRRRTMAARESTVKR
ncbi:MAG: class I SAM-dependent methyltransferase [Betaproteobacteria bacterium]|nr:MAG: class I SAM-dependent methyltransferase [Betaproteobacteria bacterium]